jgi:polyketide-type polyunsaturated fatty acid synthase PfaA
MKTIETMTQTAQRREQSPNEPLAIVGMGCLFPKANNVDEYWSNIKNLVDGIGPVPPSHWNPDDYFDADPKKPDLTYAKRGGFLDAYPFRPAEFGIAPRDLEAIDTAQLLGLVVAKMALEDAGLLADQVDRKRISVILGVTGTLEMVVPLGARLGHPLWRKAMKAAGASDDVIDDAMRRISDGYVGWQENSFPGLLGNVVAGRIANRLDLGGTNCVVDAACASSLSALHMAAMELRAGRADAVLTGGVDTFNDIFMYMCFSKTPALSPTGDARPFDANADGTILGEGLGMFVVKRLSDAVKAGDRIYAVVKGLGTSSDGAGNAVYAPTADGQTRCLQDAYAQAGVSPATIELIEAHGTGTKVGDATELEALVDVFRTAKAKTRSCALGSVKSQIGHTKAAAGAAGMMKAILALSRQVLPPTAKIKEPASNLLEDAPFYVTNQPRPWVTHGDHPRRAAVSSFGFGGSNYHCVLEECVNAEPEPDWDGEVTVAAFSDDDRHGLRQKLEAFERDPICHNGDWASIRALAATTRASFSPARQNRLTLVLRRSDNAVSAMITTARKMIDDENTKHDNVFLGAGPCPKLGALFPGQGSQSIGMMRDLACRFPVFRDVLGQADKAFAAGLVDESGPRLSNLVFPPTAFTDTERSEQETALRDTEVAQPALGAVSLGALNVLRQFGIRPDAAAGHSYGELTALCAAGCYDAPSLFALSQLRGRLMARESIGDAGAMLAVMAPIDWIEAAVAEDRIGVVVANRNSPSQAVLSGSRAEIERAEQTLTRRKLRHVRLPVAAAFHSPLVADAAGPFRSALEPIEFREAQLPVFANTTSREYPRDPQAIRDLLATQLAKPVDFVAQIRNMSAAGVKTFVEVGPGHTLTRLVGAILDGAPHEAFALDASAGRNPGCLDLARVIARLAALGHVRQLSAWDPNPPTPRIAKAGLVVPICGANYRAERPKPQGRVSKPAAGVPTAPQMPPVVAPPPERKPVPSNMSNPHRKIESDPATLSRALQITQESLAAFQRLQEQTAELHRTFLEQQTEAQRTLQTILAGQQQLLSNGSNGYAMPVVPQRPTPASHPVRPIAVAPQPTAPPMPTVALESQTAPKPRKPIAPPAPPPPPKPDEARQGSLTDILLDVVAEKTGYPTEMLNLDMGLDADLGIDSIKRVEILSALQDRRPDLPSVPPDRLGSLRTLRDVVDLLNTTNVNGQLRPKAHVEASSDESDNSLQQELLAVVAEKTGYPVEMLDMDMGLDSDLGIDSIKRVEILSALQDRRPDLPAVPPDRLGSLRTLRDVIGLLGPSSPEKKAHRPVALSR